MIHFKILAKNFNATWNKPISTLFTSMYKNSFLKLTDIYVCQHVREYHLKLTYL